MNKNILIGISLIGYIFYAAVIQSVPNPKMFFDPHALLLVFGGTLAVTIFSLSFRQMQSFLSLFFYGFLFKTNYDANSVIKTLLSDGYRFQKSGIASLEDTKAEHPFIIEAYCLIAEDLLSDEELQSVLHRRKNFFKKTYSEDSKILSSLAKYPPAFGLLGATSGMISMMGNLGSGSKEQIGMGMASALVATLWGIALANFIILPFADYTERLSAEDSNIRDIIAEGVYMIYKGEDLVIMNEKLNSLIKVSERSRIRVKKRLSSVKDAA